MKELLNERQDYPSASRIRRRRLYHHQRARNLLRRRHQPGAPRPKHGKPDQLVIGEQQATRKTVRQKWISHHVGDRYSSNNIRAWLARDVSNTVRRTAGGPGLIRDSSSREEVETTMGGAVSRVVWPMRVALKIRVCSTTTLPRAGRQRVGLTIATTTAMDPAISKRVESPTTPQSTATCDLRTRSKALRENPPANFEEVKRRSIRQNRQLAKNDSSQSRQAHHNLPQHATCARNRRRRERSHRLTLTKCRECALERRLEVLELVEMEMETEVEVAVEVVKWKRTCVTGSLRVLLEAKIRKRMRALEGGRRAGELGQGLALQLWGNLKMLMKRGIELKRKSILYRWCEGRRLSRLEGRWASSRSRNQSIFCFGASPSQPCLEEDGLCFATTPLTLDQLTALE